MLQNLKRTYALSDYTVEGRGTHWYYWKTARYGDKEEHKGPYSSLASVTLMIAPTPKGSPEARRCAPLPQ